MVTRVERCGGGRIREFGVDMYTLLYLKQITSKELCSLLCDSLDRRAVWGENGYTRMYGMYTCRVPLLIIWKYHNVVNQLYSNIK